MKCGRCGNQQTSVVVVVHSQEVVIRRRHCYQCSHDFNTVKLSRESGLQGVGDPELRQELLGLLQEEPGSLQEARS